MEQLNPKCKCIIINYSSDGRTLFRKCATFVVVKKATAVTKFRGKKSFVQVHNNKDHV